MYAVSVSWRATHFSEHTMLHAPRRVKSPFDVYEAKSNPFSAIAGKSLILSSSAKTVNGRTRSGEATGTARPTSRKIFDREAARRAEAAQRADERRREVLEKENVAEKIVHEVNWIRPKSAVARPTSQPTARPQVSERTSSPVEAAQATKSARKEVARVEKATSETRPVPSPLRHAASEPDFTTRQRQKASPTEPAVVKPRAVRKPSASRTRPASRAKPKAKPRSARPRTCSPTAAPVKHVIELPRAPSVFDSPSDVRGRYQEVPAPEGIPWAGTHWTCAGEAEPTLSGWDTE